MVSQDDSADVVSQDDSADGGAGELDEEVEVLSDHSGRETDELVREVLAANCANEANIERRTSTIIDQIEQTFGSTNHSITEDLQTPSFGMFLIQKLLHSDPDV